MAYNGHERRIYKVFVTTNTEYHLRKDRCVGVRDRRSGEWVGNHEALKRTVAGSLTFLDNGGLMGESTMPKIGEAICFHGSSLVTSAVLSIERPTRVVVERYN